MMLRQLMKDLVQRKIKVFSINLLFTSILILTLNNVKYILKIVCLDLSPFEHANEIIRNFII